MAERNVLLKNVKHPFLVGLHYSFQTTDKLYFVLDFINGGEVNLSRDKMSQMVIIRESGMEVCVVPGLIPGLELGLF